MDTTNSSKMGTIAVVLSDEQWIETFSDEREIQHLENAIASGEQYPLQKVYELRTQLETEDDEFGDYVESLLSRRFQKLEVQEHGAAWMKSKSRIEHFRNQEQDAAEVIANYAVKKFKEDRKLTDFILAGLGVEVRIRILHVNLAPGTSAIAG